MKILLLNQDWFSTELRLLGHEVITCGQATHLEHRLTIPVLHINELLAQLPGGFVPDRIVWLDDSSPVMILGLEDTPIPTIFYSVDTHHHWELHSQLAHCFDHVLVAQKDYLHQFLPSGTPTTWMPLWASRHVERCSEKTTPVSFVGTMDERLNPKRVQFFNTLKEILPITIRQGNYWEIFPQADIVINQTVSSDLNFRVFEAMMCGALLLTEHSSNGLLEIFNDGEHLVTYTAGDTKDAAEKARALLAAPDRMREIAHAGREEILKKHTPLHRATVLHNILSSITKRPQTTARHLPMMINLAIASSFLERHNPALSMVALRGAVQAALASQQDGCIPNNIEAAHLVRIYARWDRCAAEGAGTRLLLAHAESLPSQYILALARVRSLLNQGKRLEAEVVASRISQEPASSVFNIAEQAMTLILQR